MYWAVLDCWQQLNEMPISKILELAEDLEGCSFQHFWVRGHGGEGGCCACFGLIFWQCVSPVEQGFVRGLTFSQVSAVIGSLWLLQCLTNALDYKFNGHGLTLRCGCVLVWVGACTGRPASSLCAQCVIRSLCTLKIPSPPEAHTDNAWMQDSDWNDDCGYSPPHGTR